ncbi:uncharacterized protein LOC144432013 [Styela clava]
MLGPESEFPCGTRSWDSTESQILQTGKEVYLPATYFDNEQREYSNSLPYKDKTLLKGVIVCVYSNTVRVKFFIDNQTTSVPKNALKLDIGDEEKDFVLVEAQNSQNEDQEENLSDESFEYYNDDSDKDPTYNYEKEKSQSMPCYWTAQNNESDSDKSNSTVQHQVDISVVESEEVILCYERYPIFKAKCRSVHCEDRQGSFFITKVFQTAIHWPYFNLVEHKEGTAITWNLCDINKLCDQTENQVNEQCSTDWITPTPLTERKRNISKWQRNIRKEARMHGQSYQYRTKNKEIRLMPKREIKKTCSSSCKKKCNEIFSAKDREVLFENYWKLDNILSKRIYITKMIEKCKIKRSRLRPDIEVRRKKRDVSFKYFLQKESGDQFEVCQTFFLTTLDVSRKQVRTALSKEFIGSVENDMRGITVPHNRFDPKKVEKVIEHICMFKTVQSHYVRKESKYQYLPPTLDVATMHRMYIRFCAENNIENPLKYEAYLSIFHDNFNIKFHQPKKDRCDICDAWDNTKDSLRTTEIVKSKAEHDQEKNLSRVFKAQIKEKAQDNSHIQASAFDFQKTLLAPAGESSSFYYSMRLRNYNFTVSDISSFKEVHCYLWNEEEAKKGSNEVASALLLYLKFLQKKGVKSVYLFCDRCAGQNCNRMVYIMLSLALNWFGFSDITLSFFVTGHSQNENDCAHSLIEKESKRLHTFTTDQWESVIVQALTKGNKNRNITMTRMSHSDILDFKFGEKLTMFQDVYKSNLKVNGSKIKWSKIMQAKFSGEKPDKFFFKYLYAEEEYQEVSFIKKVRLSRRISGTLDMLPRMNEMRRSYKKKPGITMEKYGALMKLCKKNLIPPQYHTFYESLTIQNDETDESDSDDESSSI